MPSFVRSQLPPWWLLVRACQRQLTSHLPSMFPHTSALPGDKPRSRLSLNKIVSVGGPPRVSSASGAGRIPSFMPKNKTPPAAVPAPVPKERNYQCVHHGVSKTMHDEALEDLAAHECNGGSWSSGPWKYAKLSCTHKRILRCAFKYECKCPFRLMETTRKDSDEWNLFRGNWDHTDHTTSLRKIGLPKCVQLEMMKPNVIVKKPHKLISYLRKKHGLVIDEALEKQIKDKRRAARRGKRGAAAQMQGSRAAFERLFQTHQKETLIKSESFTWHKPYIFGTPQLSSVDDSGAESPVVICMATENMLLNAYRQQQQGLPAYLCIDTTHRLITADGFCLLIIGTMSPTQHFHDIAYAIVSKEDTETHALVIKQTVAEVEAVVELYARNGWTV